MSLYFERKKDTRVTRAFAQKLADIPGGVTVSAADFTQTVLKEGTPVGKGTNGIYHIIKTAVMAAAATSSDTTYKVAKGHNYKVGDIITTGTSKKASAITAIATDSSDETIDDITVGASLGVAVAKGDVLVQAAAATTTNTSALAYTPVGLVGEDYNVDSIGSLMVNVWVIATIKEDNIDAVGDAIKTALPTIRFI